MSCGPSKAALGLGRQVREGSERSAPEGQLGAAPGLDDAPARREHGGPAVVQAADEAVGAALDRGQQEAVGPPRHRVGGEQHAPEPGRELRLDEHGHAGVGRVGPGLRAEHPVDGVDEARPGAHVEHRLEHAGHRGRSAVLVGGRRADHEGVLARPAEGLPGGAGGALLGAARVRPAAVVPLGGEDDTGQDRQTGPPCEGEVGGFGSDERSVDGALLGEVHQVRPPENGGERLHDESVDGGPCTPVARRLHVANSRSSSRTPRSALVDREVHRLHRRPDAQAGGEVEVGHRRGCDLCHDRVA